MGTFIYVVCGLVGVLGRLLGLFLGGRRELANRRLEFRLHVLVDAWRTIERAANRGLGEEALEQALADIRLFGAPTHAHLAARVERSMAGGRSVRDLDDLREALRVDLRAQMRLGRVDGHPVTHARREERGTLPRRLEARAPARLRAGTPGLHVVREVDAPTR